MRILFMGTPEFAVPSLHILLDEDYPVVSVVTTPDKPQGRGQKVGASAVKEFAANRKLPILQPENLRDPAFVTALTDLRPDLIVVVAFRILPAEVFTIPRLGAFNLHASLLPRYRGAAPINWAIMNGEEETGVTTFFLQERVDTGSVLLQEKVSIGPDETAGELHDRLSVLGAQVVLKTVRMIESGNAQSLKQDESLVSRAPKIFKDDCRINWSANAGQVHNFVRGLSPAPCAWTTFRGKMLKVYRTSLAGSGGDGAGVAAEVRVDRLAVCTSNGLIALDEVQLEGKKRMMIAEFLRGHHVQRGDRFGE
jgi:methionyl-tRNA formyltransferase